MDNSFNKKNLQKQIKKIATKTMGIKFNRKELKENELKKMIIDKINSN
jgi:hypothetical protein